MNQPHPLAMADMSRAIREQIERYAATLQELDDATLADLTIIVQAFGADLAHENARRIVVTDAQG